MAPQLVLDDVVWSLLLFKFSRTDAVEEDDESVDVFEVEEDDSRAVGELVLVLVVVCHGLKGLYLSFAGGSDVLLEPLAFAEEDDTVDFPGVDDAVDGEDDDLLELFVAEVVVWLFETEPLVLVVREVSITGDGALTALLSYEL